MAKNLLKKEGFVFFKEFYNKDIECARNLMIEGTDYLLRGFKVASVEKTGVDGSVVFLEDLGDDDLYTLYEQWLKGDEIK